MNFLIINSVALNGGDEALLLATIMGIKNKYPNAQIIVLAKDYKICNKYIQYVNFLPDWEYSISRLLILQTIRKVLEKMGIPLYHRLSLLFTSKTEKRVVDLYKNADVIISSPGGYIHDIYGYHWRLKAFEMALYFKKNLFFLGHSIGPFHEDNKKYHLRLKQVFEKSQKIILRENISKKHLIEIGYKSDNVVVTIDIAFSLFKYYKHLFVTKNTYNRKLALTFREWLDKQTTENIIQKAIHLSNYLISKGYHLTFISTCQGVLEYKDDSKIAIKIIHGLDPENRKYCDVIDKRLHPDELIKAYSEFDAYIGMRLHGAILSMLGGTPAFNIGYEDKTKGIFDILGLSNYQIWYSERISDWIKSVDNFLNNLERIHADLKNKIENASDLALSSFSYI